MSTDFEMNSSFLFSDLTPEAYDFFEDNHAAIQKIVEELCSHEYQTLHMEVSRGEIKDVVIERVVKV